MKRHVRGAVSAAVLLVTPWSTAGAAMLVVFSVGPLAAAQQDSAGSAAATAPGQPSDSAGTPSTQDSGAAQATPPAFQDSANEAGQNSTRAAQTGPQATIQEARQRLEHIGRRVALSIVFLLILAALSRLLVWTLNSLAERSAKRRLLYKRLVPILRIGLWVFAAYFVVQVIFQVTTSNLLAAGAAIGVAIGFAAQDLLKNIFGGLVIIFDQPFQVGDKITVGDTYGEVTSIGLRSTRVVTPSDSMVSVPNSLVVDSQVSNANTGALDCQVVTELFLPGWVDEGLAKRLAYEAAAVSPYAYLKKPIVVLVGDEFRETFLTRIKIKAYVLDARYEFLFQSDVTERAREEFRKHGLIPTYKDAQDLIELTRTANEF